MIHKFFVLKYFLPLVFFVFLGVPEMWAQQARKPVPDTEVKWVSFEFAIKNAARTNRMILVDFYTDWCGWCKVMDKKTYSQAHIIRFLNERFYCVKFNAEGKDTVVYKGREYSYVPSLRCNQFAYKLLNGNLGYPTTVFLNPAGDVLNPVPGYLDPPTMETLLHYYAEKVHEKGISYEDYRKNFQPTITE